MGSTAVHHASQRPHRHALFSLVPLNGRAEEVLEHSDNAHLVSSFRPYENNPTVEYGGLEVGFHIGSPSRYTLATIGREGDIVVDNPGVTRKHCPFELHEDNKEEIMLQDRSLNRSTELLGARRMPFEPGRPHRRVLVDRNINLEFGFGGTAGDLYQFQIFWHKDDKSMVFQQINHKKDNPRQARTIANDPLAILPSFPSTRIHAAGSAERIRYSIRKELGKGTFGVVWKVASVDTGDHLAVKRIRTPDIQSHEHALRKREVNTLARISHVRKPKKDQSNEASAHSTRRTSSNTWAQQTDHEFFEIFMELKYGSVQYLIDKFDVFQKDAAMAKTLLHEMLKALDYLDSKGIIHRDVKPENILYTPLPGGEFLNQLADFGLANMVAKAQMPAGSRNYMAPELNLNPGWPQTTKIDIWSLFVTLAYALNTAGFREKPLGTVDERIKATKEAANDSGFRLIRRMAIDNPSDRATAGEILDKAFQGQGRTTSRN